MSSGRSLLRRHLAKIAQLFIVALLLGTALSQQASAQIISFTSPIQLIDNDANQGSPTIIAFNNQLVMYYVNHSNNTIYVDRGLTGNPQSTGIQVWSAEITDVGAAVLFPCGSFTCPTMLLSYVNPNQSATFATSTDGLNFGPGVTPSPSALGVGNQNVYTSLVPAMTSSASFNNRAPTAALIASVGATDHLVYMSTTNDGQSFSELYGTGQAVSNFTTTSRPSLAYWAATGEILIGFTSNQPGTRVAVVGPADTGPGAPKVVRADISWGNNNRSGNFAGLGLTSFGNVFYVFGQDTASSQNLKYIYTSDGTSWSGPVNPGNQMRWTPSLTGDPNVVFTLVYQDDGNTNISYRQFQ